MLRYVNFDIVFQEIPNEVTLAVNISNCPNNCEGCHSPYLREDTGEMLNENLIAAWIEKYGKAITCICFMGGDAEPCEVERLAAFIHAFTDRKIKTGWYSGQASLPDGISPANFNYIKLGAYFNHLGGLNKPTTNQRLYIVENETMTDITDRFWKHG
ncbi:MAG: anaerobic ribonucleoside-triphosphate reductase activating protein [Prevotellaceae bacterium]|jgi:anaerobic ribonucleoside-triphosphate reductase activating protein|nr:anaerobic ribonucleoside-triphosphate reductase activating protein [Prevotellaceae bacterium]